MAGLEILFWYWLVLGVAFMTIEIFMSGAFFLGMGMAAIIVGGIVWIAPDQDWEYQVFWFAILAIISVVGLRRFVRARPIESEQPLLNQRGKQYVGRTFTLDEPIVNGQGKIRVDDSTWKVHADDCAAGTTIIITGVDSVVLQAKVVD